MQNINSKTGSAAFTSREDLTSSPLSSALFFLFFLLGGACHLLPVSHYSQGVQNNGKLELKTLLIRCLGAQKTKSQPRAGPKSLINSMYIPKPPSPTAGVFLLE